MIVIILVLAWLGLFGDPSPATTLDHCQAEDQVEACYWDAQELNTLDTGADFIVTVDGSVVYIELTGKDKVTVDSHTYELRR